MNYLDTTELIDSDHPAIQKIIAEFDTDELSNKEKAIGIYTKVRDGWKYDPYNIGLTPERFRASHIAQKDTGHCVEKSVLLVACLRALGLPARLHLGKVKNHIAVERLMEKFGSNELTPHGMVNVQIDGKWLKMSPAFNKSLCKKFSVEPLEFDGENDSFLQQYNSEGSKFMEYIEDYGYFDDVPLEFMKNNVIEHYPHIFAKLGNPDEFKL